MESLSYEKQVLSPIAQRLESHLQSDLGIPVSQRSDLDAPARITLKHTTVSIGLAGSARMLFVLSYDLSLIEALTRAFAMGEVAPEEIEEVQESVASEVANIVLGNSIPNFPDGGKGITMTPPLVIWQARTISVGSDAKIATTLFETDHGAMAANIIWPHEL